MDEKQLLRARLRRDRKAHVAALPAAMRNLVFLRPPSAVAALAAEGATVGLYHATSDEAPTRRYAEWFFENGRKIALPWFAGKGEPMQFRAWDNPYDAKTLEADPYGARQPLGSAPPVTPDIVLVPLVGFTQHGARLGQGGGHYDRWLAQNPDIPALGLAWDCQLVDSLPLEPHDRPLSAIVTPTRLYGAFD